MAPLPNPPGFLGNLTSEQERCLLRLWTLFVYLVEESSLGVFEELLRTNSNLDQVPYSPSLSIASPRSPYLYPPPAYSQRASSILSRTESVTPRQAAGTFLRPCHARIIQAFRDAGLNTSQVRSIRRFLACMSPEEVKFSLFTTIKNENPDVYMLRYLRVAKWDVNRALAKMLDALVWRFRKMQIEKHMLPRGESYAVQQEVEPSDKHQKETARGFIAQLRMGKFFVRGVDRMDRPVCIMRMRLHQPGAQTEESLHLFLTHTVECVRLLVSPPVESATVLLDMTGFTLANMEYGPVKFILRCFDMYYPESLGVLLVHNAPPVFAGVWKIIKPWIDPDLVSRIHFTQSLPDLERFIDIDNILSEYGGNDDWEYEYPEPEPKENQLLQDYNTRNILLADRHSISEEFIMATSHWIAAVRVGDHDLMKQATTSRTAITQRLSMNYWDLDPYARARNYLDRMGLIPSMKVVGAYYALKPVIQIQTAKIIQVAHVERAKLRVVNV